MGYLNNVTGYREDLLANRADLWQSRAAPEYGKCGAG